MNLQDDINAKTLIFKLDLKNLENLITFFDKKKHLNEKEKEYYLFIKKTIALKLNKAKEEKKK